MTQLGNYRIIDPYFQTDLKNGCK